MDFIFAQATVDRGLEHPLRGGGTECPAKQSENQVAARAALGEVLGPFHGHTGRR